MKTKLTTMVQVALLREGDTVKRFPSNCNDVAQDKFDEQRTNNIDTYTIKRINPQNDMFWLVSSATQQMFATAGEIGRVSIKSQELVTESVWWV
jgi:hypothetical protein